MFYGSVGVARVPEHFLMQFRLYIQRVGVHTKLRVLETSPAAAICRECRVHIQTCRLAQLLIREIFLVTECLTELNIQALPYMEEK